DPSTWPGDESDSIWKICHAIALAEGADLAGSIPDRLNNPGDISDGRHEFGAEDHDGSDVTCFPTKLTGWTWLYNKVQAIVSGQSEVYSPGMSWMQLAQKWAGDWAPWVAKVCEYLGVSPSDTLCN